MVFRDTLNDAKAFLCWDVFPDLSVQLVEKTRTISFFLPPSSRSTAVIFLEKDARDFSGPLFLLFHEAGHCLQLREAAVNFGEKAFWEKLEHPTGPDRISFEKEGWSKGKVLFESFLERKNLPQTLISEYEAFGARSAESYR